MGFSDNLPYEKIGKNEPVCIADEVPFDIPESWEWVRLESICTKLVDGDHNPPKGCSYETAYVMVSSTNINDDCIVELEKVRYLEKNIFDKENERTNAATGDIFFTSVGSLGRSCVYEGGLNICFQRSVSVIHTLIFNYYLKYCLDSAYIQQKIIREATGTAQKGFYLNQLALLLIPIPPIEEQHRIVSKYLETVQMQKEYYKTNETLDVLNSGFPATLKKSILQYAVQGNLVPQDPADEPASVLLEHIRAEKEQLIKAGKIKRDKHESVIFRRDNSYYEKVDGIERCIDDEIPFEIPDSWKWTTIGTTCTNIQYGSSRKSESTGTMAVLRMGNIQNGRIDTQKLVYTSDKEEIAHFPLEYNDLLFNRTNSKELVGKTAIYKSEIPAIYAGYLIRITPLIDSDYLNYVMQTQFYWIYCQNVRSDAIGQSNINAEKLKNFIYPLPPLHEQKRIVKKLSSIFTKIK